MLNTSQYREYSGIPINLSIIIHLDDVDRAAHRNNEAWQWLMILGGGMTRRPGPSSSESFNSQLSSFLERLHGAAGDSVAWPDLIEELSDLFFRARLLEFALDLFDHPLVLTNRDGGIVYGNQSAATWYGQNHHFCLQDGQLRGRDANCQSAFRQALNQHSPAILALRCPAGGRPWQMAVCPLAPADDSGFNYFNGHRLVIVADPAARASLSLGQLQSLFSLTTATARVTLGLVSGKSLQEIAAENGVSINTVRSQIRYVMEKTGSHRQVELVRIVSALPRLRQD